MHDLLLIGVFAILIMSFLRWLDSLLDLGQSSQCSSYWDVDLSFEASTSFSLSFAGFVLNGLVARYFGLGLFFAYLSHTICGVEFMIDFVSFGVH